MILFKILAFIPLIVTTVLVFIVFNAAVIHWGYLLGISILLMLHSLILNFIFAVSFKFMLCALFFTYGTLLALVKIKILSKSDFIPVVYVKFFDKKRNINFEAFFNFFVLKSLLNILKMALLHKKYFERSRLRTSLSATH